jgi:hypothetical protein
LAVGFGLHWLAISSQTNLEMASPPGPVTLTADQLSDLSRKLADMRHDINNHLSVMAAVVELIRCKPHEVERRMAMLDEQRSKIADSIRKFSTEFNECFGITKP